MVRHWTVAVLFAMQAVLPVGAAVCDCALTQPVDVPACCCECPGPGECDCGCKDIAKEPANHAEGALPQPQQTVSHSFVRTQSLPQPTALPSGFVAPEPSPLVSETLLSLTRAERAPPA